MSKETSSMVLDAFWWFFIKGWQVMLHSAIHTLYETLNSFTKAKRKGPKESV
jgi:hypothetical protein